MIDTRYEDASSFSSQHPQMKTEAQLELESQSPPFQEGGAKGLCTAVGGWLALFATFGLSTSYGVYQDFYVRAGSGSSSKVSWIGSFQIFLLVFLALPAGKLLDSGHFKITILVGSIIYVFSLFMLSLAHLDKYYQLFLSQGLGMGIGSGLIYLPALAVQARHWNVHRPIIMGIVITGSSVGGIVYPIMLNNLFHGSAGFAWGVRASAFLTLGILILACFLMSDRPRSQANSSSVAKRVNIKDILTDVPFMLGPLTGGFFLIIGLFFPYFFLQLFTDLHGLSPTLAFYTLTIQNGASILGRTIPNLFAAKYGVMNMCICMSFGSGVVIFAMFGIKDTAGVVIFAILYGFFSGGVISSFAPVLSIFVRNPNELGLRLGLGYCITSFAYLVGPPISGFLVGIPNLANGIQAEWFRPIIFSGVMILAGGLPFSLYARASQAKKKGTPFV